MGKIVMCSPLRREIQFRGGPCSSRLLTLRSVLAIPPQHSRSFCGLWASSPAAMIQPPVGYSQRQFALAVASPCAPFIASAPCSCIFAVSSLSSPLISARQPATASDKPLSPVPSYCFVVGASIAHCWRQSRPAEKRRAKMQSVQRTLFLFHGRSGNQSSATRRAPTLTSIRSFPFSKTKAAASTCANFSQRMLSSSPSAFCLHRDTTCANFRERARAKRRGDGARRRKREECHFLRTKSSSALKDLQGPCGFPIGSRPYWIRVVPLSCSTDTDWNGQERCSAPKSATHSTLRGACRTRWGSMLSNSVGPWAFSLGFPIGVELLARALGGVKKALAAALTFILAILYGHDGLAYPNGRHTRRIDPQRHLSHPPSGVRPAPCCIRPVPRNSSRVRALVMRLVWRWEFAGVCAIGAVSAALEWIFATDIAAVAARDGETDFKPRGEDPCPRVSSQFPLMSSVGTVEQDFQGTVMLDPLS
nr:sucrose transport protein-like [Ipomoea batatas]